MEGANDVATGSTASMTEPWRNARFVGAGVAALLWAPVALILALLEPPPSFVVLGIAGFPVSAAVAALMAERAISPRTLSYSVAAAYAVVAILVGALVWAVPFALSATTEGNFAWALFTNAVLGLIVMGIPLFVLGFILALLWSVILRSLARKVL